MSDQMADLAAKHRLRAVGSRPPLFHYLKSTWGYHEFIVALARARFEAQNERTRFGMLWVVFKPALNAAIYGLIFGAILGGNRPHDFLPFVVIGVFTLEFFSNSFSSGARAITSNANLVKSLKFPRLVLPTAEVLRQLFNFLPVSIVMLAIVMAFGQLPMLKWFLLIPATVLLTLFNWGVACFTARLTVVFRDMTNIIPYVNRIIFYTGGVFYSVEHAFRHHPTVLAALEATPITRFLEVFRGVTLSEYNADFDAWAVTAIWAIGLAVVGGLFFWRAEERYGQDE